MNWRKLIFYDLKSNIMEIPQRGEIWMIALDPTKGSEIKKTRPCLIVSRTDYNQKANTITVIPCSSGPVKYLSWEVELDETSGLDNVSRLLLPQVRVAAKERLRKKMGQIPVVKWHEVQEKLMFYLGFDSGFTQSVSIGSGGMTTVNLGGGLTLGGI